MPARKKIWVQKSSYHFRTNLRTKITREVNPPLLTGFDRKTRTEGYVKYFEPKKIGKIRLKQGKGELKLQAIRIPGEQALEFRLLMINRVEEEVKNSFIYAACRISSKAN